MSRNHMIIVPASLQICGCEAEVSLLVEYTRTPGSPETYSASTGWLPADPPEVEVVKIEMPVDAMDSAPFKPDRLIEIPIEAFGDVGLEGILEYIVDNHRMPEPPDY